MTKQQIAESLIRIKALKDALDAELKDLRQHIPVGEKIETPIGDVHHVESNRTTYDEKGLYDEMVKILGLDPKIIGDVVVKVNRKKFADAITKGKIPSSLVDEYSETKEVPTLRIKPKADHNELNQSTMEKVATIVKKS